MNLFAKGKAAPAPAAKGPAFSPIDRVGLLGLLDQIVNTGGSGVLELHEPRGNWVYAFQAGALTHASGGRVRGARQAFDLLWEFQAGECMFTPGPNAALAGNLYIDKARLLDLLHRSQTVLQGPSAPYIPPDQQRPIAPVPRPYSPPSPAQMPPAWQPGTQQAPGWPPAYPQPATGQGQPYPVAPGQPPYPGQPYPPAPQGYPGGPVQPYPPTAPQQQYVPQFPAAPQAPPQPLPPQAYPPVRGNIRPQVPPAAAPPVYPSFPPQAAPPMPGQAPPVMPQPPVPAPQYAPPQQSAAPPAPARPATPPSFSVPPMPIPKKAQAAPVYQPQPAAPPAAPTPEPPKAAPKDDLAALRASLVAQAPAVKPAPSASWNVRTGDGVVAPAAAPDGKSKGKGKAKAKDGKKRDSKLMASIKLQLIKFLLWACERRYSPDDHWTLKDAFEVSTMELRDQFFGAFSQTFAGTKKKSVDDDMDDMAAGRMRGRGRRH